MRAYSYPGLSKAEFLAELQMHVEADRLVQGIYYENGDNWKACAIGCSLESVRRRLRVVARPGWHGQYIQYERYLGIPIILARLEDCIFEALPISEARRWPLRFSTAVPDRADLSRVWPQFASWTLSEIALQMVVENECVVRPAIQRVIAGYESNWQNDSADAAANAAADAAHHAARSAPDAAANAAAYAAAYASYAVTTNNTFNAAAFADNAADAAYDRLNAWRTMADKICALVAVAPVMEE